MAIKWEGYGWVENGRPVTEAEMFCRLLTAAVTPEGTGRTEATRPSPRPDPTPVITEQPAGSSGRRRVAGGFVRPIDPKPRPSEVPSVPFYRSRKFSGRTNPEHSGRSLFRRQWAEQSEVLRIMREATA